MTPNGNPQLEDGFARIANESLDALARTTLSDYESRCVHLLFRKTYGWRDKKGKKGRSKKQDVISYSQWVDGTGIDKRNIQRALEKLIQRKIITRLSISLPGRNTVLFWGFNKHYLEWIGYEAKPSSQETTPEAQLSFVETTLEAKPLSVETTLSSQVSSVDPTKSPQTPSINEAKPSSVETTLSSQVSSVETNTIDTLTIDTLLPKGRKVEKKPYGEFKNVFLTHEEYKKLEVRFNTELPAKIENLSQGIKSKGYKYKDSYSTLLRWAEKDAKEKHSAQRKVNHGTDKGHSEPPGGRQHTEEELRRSIE